MPTEKYSHDILKQYLLILIPLLGLLFVTAAIHYYTNLKLTQVSHETNETLNVDLAHKAIESELSSVVSDLMFLSQLNELQAILQQPNNSQRKNLEHEFLTFSKTKGRYDQIRYLNINGDEIIRINFQNGNPSVVAKTHLQNKADRYYFRETIRLRAGQVYTSPFDLNTEHGHLETPYKPVIRFATPLYDSQGQKRGILVLNFLGDVLLQNFKQAAANIASHIHLLNYEGYWLSSPKSEDAWGFMFDERHSFAKSHPHAWQHILKNSAGRFESTAGLFSFNTVSPAYTVTQPGATDRTWKIVSLTPTALYQSSPVNFFSRHLSVYGILSLLILVGGFVVASISVKQRKIKAQNAYERLFRKTLESIKLAAISIDAQGKVTFCNDYLLEQIGWNRNEVIGKNWLVNFVAEQDQERIRSLLGNAVATGTFPSTHEMRVTTQNSATRLFFWNNTLSYDANGQVSGLTCIGEDVTEKRATEEQLNILSRAVEQSPNPVILTNIAGIMEYVNPKFTELTGYTYEEAIGQKPSILKSGETDSDDYQDLWETISNGNEWRGLFHNRKKNGELYWEYTAISPIRNNDGDITHFLAIKEDITERKRLEEEVAQRDRELAQAQALAVVGRMSSMIAHDLRNPLSSIKMGLQILGKRVIELGSNEGWDAEAKEIGLIALEQVRYMENILADLLQYSRPDALQPEWLSVDKLLDMTISSTEKTIKEYNAEIITEYQSQLPTVHGDATKLRQVFSNLILNALQATENTERIPEIRIQTRMELLDSIPKIRIEFRDNGLGIDPEYADKLFEPFYTTKAKGTGLGLAIVKRILDQHHGNIILSRNPTGGTCVTVILPTGPVH